MKPATSIPFILCLMLAGCASYKYEISSADGPVRSISKDQDLVVSTNPAQLRLKQVDSRCVLMIENPGKELLSLQGNGCAIVDPSGQSRAIAARVIPQGAYLKLILPPVKVIEQQGPTFGFGIGMRVNASDKSDSPRRAVYLSESSDSQEYWEWDGAGSIKLFLSIRQNDAETKHQFTITRTKN